MKRQVIKATLLLSGEAVLLAFIAGCAIGTIGYLNQWNTSQKYSNAFFIAGLLIIVAGVFSRMGAGQEMSYLHRFNARGFQNMSPNERVSFVIKVSSSMHLTILGLLSGILCIIISVLVMKFF